MYVRPRKGLMEISQDAFAILTCVVWTKKTFVDSFEAVLVKYMPFGGVITRIPMLLVWALLIGFSVPYIYKKIRLQDILLTTGILVFYALNIFYAEASRHLIDRAPRFLMCYFAVYIGLFYDEKMVYKRLYYWSMAALLLNSGSIFLHVGGEFISEFTGEEYSMVMAYENLPYVTYILYYSVREKTFLSRIMSLLGIALIINMGTRGPVLCMLVFGGFLFLRSLYRYKKYFVLIGPVVVALIIVVAENIEGIINFMSDTAAQLGMSDRVFFALKNNQFLYSPSRETLGNEIIEAIKARPLTGYGIAGDRYISWIHMLPDEALTTSLDTMYCHNIALEFLVSYGVILGSLLLVLLVFIIVKALIVEKRSGHRIMIIMLLCGNGLLKLLMSSSYLLESGFYCLIGLCLASLRYRRDILVAEYKENEQKSIYDRKNYDQKDQKNQPAPALGVGYRYLKSRR